MVFHWSLSDRKSPQVSRTLLSILADLSNAVVWIVFIHPVISMSSSYFINPLVTVPRAPIPIGINVTFMFRSLFFFQFPSKVEVFIPLFTFFQFYSVDSRDSKVHNFASSLFLLSGHLAEIRRSVCISKSLVSLYVSFSRTDVRLCIYHFLWWSNFNFLHNSQGIPLPTQSSVVLYSFCANLRHSLIMWLMVSSLSPHNLHLLFCSVLSILALIWLVLLALFCAAIKKDTVCKCFPFLVSSMFSCERSRLLVA